MADGYRIDTSYLDDWNAVRPIYKAGGNQDSSGKNLVMRFTTRPDAFTYDAVAIEPLQSTSKCTTAAGTILPVRRKVRP